MITPPSGRVEVGENKGTIVIVNIFRYAIAKFRIEMTEAGRDDRTIAGDGKVIKTT
jgi:hypothetical protein